MALDEFPKDLATWLLMEMSALARECIVPGWEAAESWRAGRIVLRPRDGIARFRKFVTPATANLVFRVQGSGVGLSFSFSAAWSGVVDAGA